MDMKEQSLDFLWITYFGITKTEAKNNKNKAAFACADRAYRDLCRRIPYRYSSSEIEENKKEYKDYIDLKDSFREVVCDYIINSIEDINGEFDDFHRTTCGGIIALSDGTDNEHPEYKKLFKPVKHDTAEKIGLNYGLAQKWLNMTIKNMLVMGLWDDLFKHYLSSIHVPIDSYILDAAGGTKGDSICEGEDVKHLGIKSKKYFGEHSWSKIPDDEEYIKKYYQYQDEIRTSTNNNQIEWEHEAWIAESKKNKK